MPKPDNATAPSSGKWAKDGAMTQADYVDWFAGDSAEKSRENTKLAGIDFVSAGYEHWQNTHGTQAELALTSFGSAAGATQWIDYDNNFFGDNAEYQKVSSLVPGTYIFQATTANDDGTYTMVTIGRFGKVVMEFYAYAKGKNDDAGAEQPLVVGGGAGRHSQARGDLVLTRHSRGFVMLTRHLLVKVSLFVDQHAVRGQRVCLAELRRAAG